MGLVQTASLRQTTVVQGGLAAEPPVVTKPLDQEIVGPPNPNPIAALLAALLCRGDHLTSAANRWPK